VPGGTRGGRVTNGRDKALAELVAHVRTHGLPSEPSVRRFADAIGSSHRMLAYYFGSREELLAAILAAMRAEERDTLLSTATEWSLRDAALAMWSHYTAPERRAEHQSFFYVFSLALQQPEMFEAFLASLDAWTEVCAQIARDEGLTPARARDTARLLVGATRGLLIDRLTSDAPQQVDRSFRLLLDLTVPAAEHAAL